MKTVLVIAGYDPSGGAGILADIKAIAAHGCYGAAAITSITFQNTTGVFGVENQSRATLAGQLKPIFDDLTVDAVKTGMLPTAEIIETTATALEHNPCPHVIVDPVVRSTSGFDLIDDEALAVLIRRLFPLATLVTPNIVEARRITGLEISGEDGMRAAAARLVELGARAALVKGGHVDLNGQAVDILFDGHRFARFSSPFLETTNTHGTGCTLASAIAAGCALGYGLDSAVQHAKDYVTEAIRTAPGIGQGHGPLNHFPKDHP